MKKLLKFGLVVLGLVLLICYAKYGCDNSYGISITPLVVGSAATDSVRINFGTIDTTYYPAVLDADSLVILVYPPDNAAAESTADGGAGVFNLTTGYYQYHRRGSNATPDLGIYSVCVKAWRGSALRGIGTCSYLVTGAGTYHYGVQDSTRDLLKDSVANAILDANKPNFKSTGFATAADGDSVIQAIADANKANFKATGFATSADGDSVIQAIADANKANFKATGFATAADGDSVIQAIADGNKQNFYTWSAAQRDEVIDSLRVLMLNADSVIQAIADANKANFMADVDSILQAIADANKANFMADVDGVVRYSVVDSVLRLRGLHIRGTTATDTGFIAIGNTSGHGFFAQGGATGHGLYSLGGSSTGAGFYSKAATSGPGIQADGASGGSGFLIKAGAGGVGLDIWGGGTTGDAVNIKSTNGHGIDLSGVSGASKYDIYGDIHGTIDSVTDAALCEQDSGWIMSFKDSTENAIADANKANFKYAGGADSVRSYLATHDSTLLETAASGGASNWSNDQRDSVLKTIEDANKVNYMRWTAAQRDSILKAIEDANKTNFSSCGWGAHTLTLYLLDDSDSTAVSGVTINIYDSTSGVWQAGHTTPVTGTRQFSLDASTYAIHLQDPPNSITSPEYMTISADTTDTFWVTVFDPGTPAAATLCRIYGWAYDINDNPRANCKLTVYIERGYSPVTNTNDVIITPYKTYAFSNTNGYYYMDVYRSDSLTAGRGGTVKYELRLDAPDGTLATKKRHYEVPDSTTHFIIW